MSKLERVRHYVTETLLWIAAAIGLVAIILVVCAYLFNTSIILFRTGSMEPTIPAGSAALVREIPASEVEVGDVLTVERPDQLPVTHRVTSVEPGETSDERVITMQGDANESPDPAPYAITEGRVLLGSVPGLANPINQLNNPYVLGVVTLAAALLVGWAFWPRDTSPSEASASVESSSTTSTGPRHARSVVGVLTVALLLPGTDNAFANSSASHTVNVVEENIRSEFITLTSIYAPSSRLDLSAGTASVWDIGVDIDAPSVGAARTGLRATGEFPLQVTVLSCSSRWTDDPTSTSRSAESCDDDYRIVDQGLLLTPDEDMLWIDDFSSQQSPWLRLIVELPPSAETSGADTAQLKVHVQAQGDEVSTGTDFVDTADQAETPPDPQSLARTGFPVLLLLLVAVGSVIVGRWLQSRKRTLTSGGDSS